MPSGTRNQFQLYGVEVYGNTTKNHISYMILRIAQNKPLLYCVTDLYKNYNTLPHLTSGILGPSIEIFIRMSRLDPHGGLSTQIGWGVRKKVGSVFAALRGCRKILKWLDRSSCRLACGFAGAQGTMY